MNFQFAKLPIQTTDGWKLQLLSFLPDAPTYPQPILCIHGFSQSHLTWTTGRFAHRLAEQGISTYVLDLRGHGGSAVSCQEKPYPDDIAYNWDTSAFLERDIPAAMALIQKRHPGQKLVLCGHSLGGILSIITTLQRQGEIAALIPLAAPIDARHMGLQLRWTGRALSSIHRRLPGVKRWWRTIPMHRLFQLLDIAYHGTNPGLSTLIPTLVRHDKRQIWPQLWHPDFTSSSKVREILQTSYPEAMGVVVDILRWSLRGQLDIGSTQHVNYTPHFHSIHVPVIAAWGERDILAPPACGDVFFRNIRSKIQQRLSLTDTRHIDIVAGHPAEHVINAIIHLFHQLKVQH